ncbi:Hypothetical protein CINCED_3A018318 [Cinara cedri]|uniref:Uncharacterized protein n=1 Tax=Cinara cedri TaxID=506608 RepID=A0A5E4M927_9HEMI|nr:Hypothetical protein CINCED_3A018318 [Cinara cedri]
MCLPWIVTASVLQNVIVVLSARGREKPSAKALRLAVLSGKRVSNGRASRSIAPYTVIIVVVVVITVAYTLPLEACGFSTMTVLKHISKYVHGIISVCYVLV